MPKGKRRKKTKTKTKAASITMFLHRKEKYLTNTRRIFIFAGDFGT
jgi:hypothetical protein